MTTDRNLFRLINSRPILFTILALATAALGQSETQPVDRSVLANIKLPPGAQRVNDGSVPVEIKQSLQQIVAQSDGKLRQGDSETLLWTGSEKRRGAQALVDQMSGSLNAAGWQFEVSGNENGISFFSALLDGEERRALVGFFGDADGTFVWAWTEVHSAANGSQQLSVPRAPGVADDVNEYEIPALAGWSRTDSPGKITLSNGNNTIAFLPLMEATGDLESNAKRILWQVFRDCEPWADNGFTPDYGTFERGRTVQGLEYFRIYRYAKRVGDDGSVGGSRFDAVLLLVKVGNKVAVIAGRSPFQSDYSDNSAVRTLDLMLYDLRFKRVGTSYDMKKEILGSWAAASSTVAVAYTLNANGSFNKGGAIQFRTSHDETRDKVTTTSYGMTDRYSVAGNLLTQTYKRTGEVVKYKIRAYETKYDKDSWQSKLGFLPVSGPDSGTIVFRRSN